MPNANNVKWIPSRYNHHTIDESGNIVLYNSFMGAFARISNEDAATVGAALAEGLCGPPTPALVELLLHGFFVPSTTDEQQLVRDQYRTECERTDILQLVLLPNENCNFRCKYCSQTFARNKMKREVIEGIVNHVRSRVGSLAALRIGWFGGEPLTAPEIIDEVSTRLQELCGRADVTYSSSITTNGYLLTPEVGRMLMRCEVRRFQITLDGTEEDHDRLRVLVDGHTGTHRKIINNLIAMRQTDELFRIVVRVNFDSESVNDMGDFMDQLKTEFGNDGRFCLDFHPVGKWGGPNDAQLQTCGVEDGRYFSLELARKASERGFDMMPLREQLKPFGSRCYAANPHSFVIGSDGTVYKCTVAFEDPRNQVGRIDRDGKLVLDETKHAMWIHSGAEADASCQSCSFQPACQGNACPLHRMDTGQRPCPTVKTNMTQTLHLLSEDHVRKFSQTAPAPAAVCES